MRAHVLPPEVIRLCRTLAMHGETRLLPSPPAWRHSDSWGEFVFRAYRMEPEATTATCPFVGISLTLLEPNRLRLARRIGAMSLSHRESQLCLLLATGVPRSDIAHTLGISDHTVVAHCRNLYAKLGVHTHAESIDRLRPDPGA